MSQAGMFKGMALDSMKKQFTPTSRPFLVLDQDGSFLKRFDTQAEKPSFSFMTNAANCVTWRRISMIRK